MSKAYTNTRTNRTFGHSAVSLFCIFENEPRCDACDAEMTFTLRGTKDDIIIGREGPDDGVFVPDQSLGHLAVPAEGLGALEAHAAQERA